MFFLQVFILALACLASCSARPGNPGTLASEAPDQAAICTPPFIQVSGGCFFFQTTVMSWNDARDACQNMPGETTTDLATVADCNLHSSIWQHILAEYGQVSFWLGGLDEGQEGSWHWVATYDTVPMGLPFWYPGYPLVDTNRNCLVTQTYYGYFLDYPCNGLFGSICQEYGVASPSV